VLLVAWHTTIYACEIKEELDADITVGELIETAQYDYSTFHLTMHCFLCELVSDHVVLLEHEAAKWLDPDELDSVDWLPADRVVVETLKTE
jgi:8-oxo-dGTP diphosphatase